MIVRKTVIRSPERVQHDMEQLFRALVPARPHAAGRATGVWRPPLEVFELHDALIVTAEVAGMNERSLDVVFDHDVLSIRGERECGEVQGRRRYLEAGISYGTFGADIYVPFPIVADAAEASYDNGFLRIRLPKATARTIVPRQSSFPVENEEGTRS